MRIESADNTAWEIMDCGGTCRAEAERRREPGDDTAFARIENLQQTANVVGSYGPRIDLPSPFIHVAKPALGSVDKPNNAAKIAASNVDLRLIQAT